MTNPNPPQPPTPPVPHAEGDGGPPPVPVMLLATRGHWWARLWRWVTGG